MANLPYLTPDMPGLGGRIKDALDDFRVEEIPLYQASGEGAHVYFRVEKSGVATPAAVERIAKHMNVRPSEIGVAGLKDARAVTSQTMSLEHADPDRLKGFRDGRIQITDVSFHTNKLRAGHLAGNRFDICIRDVDVERLDDVRSILDVLSRRGAPNYFGPQRFGARKDTDRLGEMLVRGNLDEFVALFLGRPIDGDPPDCHAARDAFDAGQFARAMKCWPRHYANERKALAAYKRKKHAGPAIGAIDKRMKRLYVSALQSAMFNDVLAQRIDAVDRVQLGDLAQKTDSGGVFLVEDPRVDQPRADAFEISPTGPVVGYRSSLAEHEPGRIEREALAQRDLTPEDFRNLGPLKAKGARRALRFRIDQPDIVADSDDRGAFLRLTFTAPSGCYATVVLREIMKTDAVG